nr:putative reverse transcriptase domain-containing protein [Tanacetum cinerariifolium]
FDVIVGMNWLSKGKFVIVRHKKVVRIPLEGDEILWVHVHEATPVAKPSYRLALSKMQELSEQIRQELNKITVKNRYPLPRINDLFDQLRGACPFLKIDFWSGYHQLRVHEDSIPKTAFRMRRRHFESTVMPFGLTNAPVVFIELVNWVCKPYLDKFVIVSIDHILIYSKKKEEHKVYSKLVLESQTKEKLYAKFSKYPFEDDSKKTEKSSDDWDRLLDFKFDDVPKFREELPPFVHKIGKTKEALAMRISQKFALLEEIKRNKFGAPIYGPKPAQYLNCNDPANRSLALQVVTNPFQKINVWKKVISFLGSLPVPLKQINWNPGYKGCYTKEEEATGQWRIKI